MRYLRRDYGICYSNHSALHRVWKVLVLNRECCWKNPTQVLDEVLTEAALILIENFGGTHNWTLSFKQASALGLIDEPICIACWMEDGSTFIFLCSCPSPISLRICKFSKPIHGADEHEGAPASALLPYVLAIVRFPVIPWFVHSYEYFFCLSVYLSLI
jgi:hypothetical protein